MLRHLREARGVTQIELPRDTAIPKSTISKILAGRKPFGRTILRTPADDFPVGTGVLAANL